MFFRVVRRLSTCAILCGAALYSVSSLADNSIFTVLDDPSTAKKSFDGNVQAGFTAQTGNTTNSNLNAATTMTWFHDRTAYSLWGDARNTSSSGVRSSEKYDAGARSRYNLDSDNYLFGQFSWLNDRYNGYHARNVVTAGYGRQIWNGPVHTLNLEFGPGYRADQYVGGGHKNTALGYASTTYSYKVSDNTKFTQGFNVLGADDITLNSETALTVAINKAFSLKLAYDVTHNTKPPASAPDKTDTVTSINIVYNM
jgi:putative salt-induced outer membrane protein